MFELIIIGLISLVPGYLLLSLIDKRLNDVERLTLSFGVSFLIFGGLGLLLHVAGLPFLLSLLAIVPIGIFTILKRKQISFDIPRMLLIILIIALLSRFILQIFFPVPIVGDSYFHLDLAETFTTDAWFQLDAIDNLWSGVQFPFPEEYRPPFFNYIMGFFFEVFDVSYDFEIAKSLNVLIGTVAILPVYLIAKRVTTERVALIVTLFMALNPLMINQSMEAEVRIFTVYLALISFYFFMKGKEFWPYAGAFLGMLYITHYAPATILAFTYLAYFIFMKRNLLFTRQTLAMGLIFLLVISPWLVRNYTVFGDPLHNSSRNVTWMNEFNQIMQIEPPTKGDFVAYVTERPGDFIFAKVTNVYRSLFPLPFQGFRDSFVLNLNPLTNMNLIFNPMSMIITLPIFALASWQILKRLKTFVKDQDLLILYILVGIIISFSFWSYRTTFTYNFLFQQVVLMAIIGFAALEKIKWNYRKILYVAVIILLLVQLPAYQFRIDAKVDHGQFWVEENTEITDTIMVRWTNVHIIHLNTDRKVLAMPFEDEDTVIDFARQHGVDYMVIDQLDLDAGRVTIGSLSEKLELIDTHVVSEPEYSREYTNTYWIFKL